MSGKIWALSDIHLAGKTRRTMEKYDEVWINHQQVIFDNVRKTCNKNDLLLIPGDITWAKNIAKAKDDLEYLGSFPCRVILCKGNHDKWSDIPRNDLIAELPPNVTWIHDVCFRIGNVAITGCCFWEFMNVFPWPGHVGISQNRVKMQEKELKNFRKALSMMPNDPGLIKILMVHIPPIPYDASPCSFTNDISEHNIDYCIYGHAHGVKERIPACDSLLNNTRYVLCTCDWLKMKPIYLCDFENDEQPYTIDENGKISKLF